MIRPFLRFCARVLYSTVILFELVCIENGRLAVMAEHPYDAATKVMVVPQAFNGKPHPPEYFRFGNVDWIACEVLRPYPTRVCTSQLIHQMTHLVTCERNISDIPGGWWGGDGTIVRRIEQ